MAQEEPHPIDDAVVPKPTTKKYVPLDYHEQVVKELEENHKKEVDYWKKAQSSTEATHKSSVQELERLQNLYPDLNNMIKGLQRYLPNSLDNALDLFEGWFKAYAVPWTIHKRLHKRRWPPFWQWVLAIIAIGLTFEALLHPDEASKFIQANSLLILATLVIVALVIVFSQRRREDPMKGR